MAKRKPKPKAPTFARKPAAPADVAPMRVRSRGERKTRLQAELELAEAYRVVRESPYGSKVIADLLLTCSVFHDDEASEPIAVGRALGRRSVGLHISRMLGLRPEHFPEEAWAVADTASEMMGL